MREVRGGSKANMRVPESPGKFCPRNTANAKFFLGQQGLTELAAAHGGTPQLESN